MSDPGVARPAAFLGDDFTGSTDALGQFGRHGLRGILLLSAEALASRSEKLADYDVVGVAGVTRSLAGEALEDELRRAFAALARLRPRVVQYKVCSTFDSSPGVGNIGRAAEIGAEVFEVEASAIPVLAAQPDFGRYTVFGTHFVALGERVVRLDRNPSTANHPTTPMREPDLARHLGAQTALPIAGVDIRAVRDPAALERDLGRTSVLELQILDALTNDDLRRIGAALLADPPADPLFAIGSGGLSFALGASLRDALKPAGATGDAPGIPVERLLVLSGSCSEQTARQIERADERGWSTVHLPLGDLLADEAGATRRVGDAVLAAFAGGARGVIAYTARGPRGPERLELAARDSRPTAPAIGRAFATVLGRARVDAGLARVVIAGGDSCGWTVAGLDAWGLELIGAVAPAGFLCALRSRNSTWDGLEVLLKGGQVGDADLFEGVRTGAWPGLPAAV